MTKKKSKKEPKKSNSTKAVSPTALSYKGPVAIPGSNQQIETFQFNSSYYAAMNASVGGSLDFVLGTGLVTSIPDWSNISGSWHEYRVLAMEIHFQPIVSYTSSYPPIIWVNDRNNTGTLGTYANAGIHESAQIVSSRYAHKLNIKMNGPDEAVWTPSATSFSWGYIKGFGTNFAASQNVGAYLLKFLVQVRGRA